MKPAEPVFADYTMLYHLVYKEENSDTWKLFNDGEKNIRFEWYLVRIDRYGNAMFMNRVGNNQYFELKIPQNPQYYRLYVEAISGEDVKVVNTTLNIPLE